MISLRQIIIFLCSMLIGMVACFLLFVCFRNQKIDTGKRLSCGMDAGEMRLSDMPPIVWYIPGWKTEHDSQDEPVMVLQNIFPGSQITPKPWKSNDNDFLYSSQRAEIYADAWAVDLKNMTSTDRRRIILVGHSLGAKIVLRIMSRLKDWELHIRQGILLGAAENNDSPDIRKAMYASQLPILNIWNRRDAVLRKAFSIGTNIQALSLGGYGYAEPFHPAFLVQYEIKEDLSGQETESARRPDDQSYGAHWAIKYLSFLEEIYPLFRESISQEQFDDSDDYPNSWSEYESYLDEEGCTVLEYNNKSREFRVVVPNGIVICKGEKSACEEVFASAKKWNKSTSLVFIQDICSQIHELSQLRKKVQIDMIASKSEWENVKETHSWLLQRSKKDQSWRIVDPFDYERAVGAEATIRKAFEKVEHLVLKNQSTE